MYRNYPTQAYSMPHTIQASYHSAPDFPDSRSYGASHTGYPPNGPTGYSASWPGASTSAGNSYPRRSRYPPGFRFSRPNNPAGYQTQSYRQRYPPPGVYQVQPHYPQNR
ncbi:hypothetical protein MRX96_034923 [Rhipicephalus microplus]